MTWLPGLTSQTCSLAWSPLPVATSLSTWAGRARQFFPFRWGDRSPEQCQTLPRAAGLGTEAGVAADAAAPRPEFVIEAALAECGAGAFPSEVMLDEVRQGNPPSTKLPPPTCGGQVAALHWVMNHVEAFKKVPVAA